MYTRTEVERGGQQETTDDDEPAPVFIYFYENPVQRYMSEENKEVKKEAVYIITAVGENIEYRNQFYYDIIFKIIPKRIERIK